jgi:hypothetical protein
MKNIFDLMNWEQSNLEKEIIAGANEKTFNLRWSAKELEKKNEIAEINMKHATERHNDRISHDGEINELRLLQANDIVALRIKHAEELSALREEMKADLGIKAIDLEKENAVLAKSKADLIDVVMDLKSDKMRLEKELKEMTATALKYAEKSAEVKVVEPQIITPQILESKINVIPTCKG